MKRTDGRRVGLGVFRATLLVIIPVLAIASWPALGKIETKAVLAATPAQETAGFLNVINNYRAQYGLPILKTSPTLTAAAQNHSLDMAGKNYFSHTGLDGLSPFDRMRAAGYNYNTAMAENIAAGQQTADTVFASWKNSPGHNANMLGKSYKVIGIGLAYNPNSTYKWYWTTDFGGYDDSRPYQVAPAPIPPAIKSTPTKILAPKSPETPKSVTPGNFPAQAKEEPKETGGATVQSDGNERSAQTAPLPKTVPPENDGTPGKKPQAEPIKEHPPQKSLSVLSKLAMKIWEAAKTYYRLEHGLEDFQADNVSLPE